MWSITWQVMKKNLRMLVPAAIAVVIGTAFITATLLFSNAMNVSMREQISAQYGDANYVLAVDTESTDAERAYSTTYGELDTAKIGRVAGVEGTRPDMQRYATLTHGDKNVSDVVIATSNDASLLPVTISSGTAPTPDGSNEIAIPARIAHEWGIGVGDTLHLDSNANASASGTADSAFDVQVIGLTDDPKGVFNYYGGAAVASDDVLARLDGTPSINEMSTMQVFLKINPTDATAAISMIRSDIPQGFTVQSREAVETEMLKTMGGGEDITRNFLLAFGILALVVAALVIANTFQVLVAQRRRMLALLRTIGATKRQLYASVLQEALILGLAASVLGVGIGIGLMALVAASGLTSAATGSMHIVFSWQVFALPVLFGTIMTVLASFSAARTATGVTPLEAMRPLELTGQRKTRIGRAVIGILCLVAGIVLVSMGLTQDTTSNPNTEIPLLACVAGCAFVFLGAVLTALFWMPWAMRGFGSLVSLCGPSAKLAAANIRKNPRRVAATGAALLIGVTLISTLATGATDAKATMNQALDTRYSVDVIVSGVDVPKSAASQAAKVKGVEHSLYVPVAYGTYTDNNHKEIETSIVGVPDESALQPVLNVNLDEAKLGDTDVIMQRYESFQGKELAFGNTVTITEVAYDDNGNTEDLSHADLHVTQRDLRRVSESQSTAFVNEQLFNNGTFTAQQHMMLIKVNLSSGTLSQTIDGITQAFEAYPGVTVSGPVMERQSWENTVDMLLKLLVALLAVAVIIAVIGVANTLSLSVIERTKESATLRAIGMTRGQLRTSLCIEAVIIAVVATLVGMVLGTAFGWIGITVVMSSIAEVVYAIDWGTYGLILLLAIVCALLASVFPARRATRTAPVEALAEA